MHILPYFPQLIDLSQRKYYKSNSTLKQYNFNDFFYYSTPAFDFLLH